MDWTKILAVLTSFIELIKSLFAKQQIKKARANIGALTPDDVKAEMEQILSVAQWLVQLTPTTADDKLVAILQTAIENLAILNIIVWFANLFEKDPVAAVAKLEAFMEANK